MATATAELKAKQATSRPHLALGLTFLLVGVGFSSPLRLVPRPPEHIWQGAISKEALNLYALTAFAGWSHFVYAWRGQWLSSRRFSASNRAAYWVSVLALLGVLLSLRFWLGVAVFSLLAWIYNIAHFVKAEVFFAGTREIRAAYYSPVAAFAWFTLCLFAPGPFKNLLLVFSGTALLAAIILLTGGWRLLASGDIRLPLLTLFLLGETLVWSSYGPYMSEAFRVGIYIFHIAAAGFYHYLTAYFFAESANHSRQDAALTPATILAINAAIVIAGCAVAWFPSLHLLRPVFGVEWFTLWVALHLAASDLQPWWKRHILR
jgi:hypothetical protein